MIKNRGQRAAAVRKLRRLQDTLTTIEDPVDKQPYEDMIASIGASIAEFEAIEAGVTDRFELQSLDDLVEALVKVRMARGWTQSQLADRVGVAEQQVQRDESGGYESAALYRLADVVDALDYEFHGSLKPRPKGVLSRKKYSESDTSGSGVGYSGFKWNSGPRKVNTQDSSVASSGVLGIVKPRLSREA